MNEKLICKWGYKPKTYKFERCDDGTFVCWFGGAAIALPQEMQAVLFHDVLVQAGYKHEPTSLPFNNNGKKIY